MPRTKQVTDEVGAGQVAGPGRDAHDRTDGASHRRGPASATVPAKKAAKDGEKMTGAAQAPRPAVAPKKPAQPGKAAGRAVPGDASAKVAAHAKAAHEAMAAQAPGKGPTPASKEEPVPGAGKDVAKDSAKDVAKDSAKGHAQAAQKGTGPREDGVKETSVPAGDGRVVREAAVGAPSHRARAKAAAHKVQAEDPAHRAHAKKAAAPPAPEPEPRHDLFFKHQRDLLMAERNNYTRQAQELRAQAEALALEHEPGDVQFDEEGGEGGTANVDRELDLHLSAQAQAAVEEIDAALAKIAAGTYGRCENCGSPIPRARLEALPHARLCVSCKSGGLSARRP